MILILGGSGYIGSAFARKFEAEQTEFRSVARAEIDYTDRDTLIECLRSTKPSFLINAAGYTGKPNVDACEDHKVDCLLGNAVLPGIIREACEACDLPWGHVSSGCIYSGTRADGAGFTEQDPPNFCLQSGHYSFYSAAKAMGEQVLEGADNAFLWRLRIPFDSIDSERNYLSQVMRCDRLLNVTNSMSQLDEFVDACWHCWNERVPFGIYNVTNTGCVTTREVASMIAKYLGPTEPLESFRDEAEFMEKAAKTPRSSCVLDNSKLLATGAVMSEVHDAIAESLRQWKPMLGSGALNLKQLQSDHDNEPPVSTKTVHVQLAGRWFDVVYPYSFAMRHVLEDVFTGREYPYCIPDFVKPSMIVDIGGNVGAAAIWFHACYPDARIVSFEPSPMSFAFLQKNTAELPAIETRNYGLLDRDLETSLYVGQYHLAQSSLVHHQEATEQSEPITLRRASKEFDSLGVDRISILKIDTEGCEVPILRDLSGWFGRIDAIYVEYHSEADRREIDQLLSDDFYLVSAVVSRGNLGTLVYLSQSQAKRSRYHLEPPIMLHPPAS